MSNVMKTNFGQNNTQGKFEMNKQQNTQQPVAWLSIDCIGERYLCFSEPSDNDEKLALYTARPVPRDVLVLLSRWEAFGKAMLKAGSILPRNLVADTESALADRYACQAQPEPVNQQLLAALKMVLDDPDALDGRPRTYKCVMEAIAAAEAAQPVDKGPWRHGITKDMKPRVFIESDDFTHDVRLYVDGDFADTAERVTYAEGIAQQLNAAQPVAVPDARIIKLLRDLVFFLENSTNLSSRNYHDRRNQIYEDATNLLAAAQKPEGGE